MNDDRLLLELRRWLQEERVTVPDAEEAGQRIASRLPTVTRRRRRRWRLPFHARNTNLPATTDTTDHQSSPIPDSNGYTPTIIGRTSSMLSPVKAIAAGAIVFALGGAVLIAQPSDQTVSTVPAADGVAVSMDAAWVTGTLRPDENSFSPFVNNCTQPERTIGDDAVRETGYHCETQLWETDDPRLTGEATLMWNADVYRLGPAATVTSGGVREVVNENGRWLCSSGPSVAQGNGISVPRNPDTVTCVGSDGYAGLMAVLNVDDGDMDTPGSVEGLVFAGEVPTPPEPATE